MTRIAELAGKIPGTSVAWSGLSYQERLSSGQAPILYGLSLLVVFLCLAALYESWSIPIAVLLVIPLGLVGAILAVTLRGLDNDIYFQVGLLTAMGLAAKNAILIVEVARELRAPLDVFIVRKLGLPGHEEFAMGAIATGGVRVLNEDVIRHFDVTDDVVAAAAAQEQAELERRDRLYRDGRPAPELRGRTVIVVDDASTDGFTIS